MTPSKPRVGLFITCLVDMFRPTVGFSAVKLLEEAGCDVDVPMDQTCCGQPAFNSGDNASARKVARPLIDMFADYDYVVAPSGSCAGMIKKHFPELFADDPAMADKVQALSDKTWELVSFLTDVMKVDAVPARFEGKVTYHDSCSGLRELGVKEQPRKLLNSIKGLEISELTEPETCCGFGGTFCVKYPEISGKMVGDKTRDITQTGAKTLLAGDLGCLMNMAGKLAREGSNVEVRHVAEVLADMTMAAPSIAGSAANKDGADMS
ncbi:(Fe-S)-binding protein [Thalassospira sp.]|uniref:(Fe-S)-binding protein n=1 Tax=Thalassospira sp. TaxID=1912094 RepID=UPI0032EF3985